MDLHTTLVATKAVLAGQAPVPMTELTAQARALFDPAFSNGMGSLQEDAERGLRCPLRGCGDYFHQLGQHVAHAHPEIGGATAFRRALSIPSTAPLVSSQTRAKLRTHRGPQNPPPTPTAAARAAPTRRETVHTMGSRNLKGRCEAQLGEKLRQLTAALGHTPDFKEATTAWGSALVSYCVRLYDTWNGFKRAFDVATLPRGGQVRITLEMALEALGRYAQVHGDLPTNTAATRAQREPPVPNTETLLRVLSATSWPVAMERAALLLNLRDSRYHPMRIQLAKVRRRCQACGQITTDVPCQHCGATNDAAWRRIA